MCPRRSSTSIEIGVFGTRKGDRLKVLFRKWRSKLYLDGPVCSACGKELLAHIRGGMCPECEKTSVKLGTDICGKCGRVLANEAEFCDTCIRNERAFVRARSCYVYEGAPKKFVYRLKFGGRRYLAAFIAEAMVDRYLDCGFECDCVVAVPLSAKRKRKRGYNQAELIAEELSSRLKLPLIDGALVFRSLEDVGGNSGLIQQLTVYIDFQSFFIKVVKRNFFSNLAIVFITLLHFGNGNFFAVDNGGHAVFSGRAGIERIQHQQGESSRGCIALSASAERTACSRLYTRPPSPSSTMTDARNPHACARRTESIICATCSVFPTRSRSGCIPVSSPR